MLTRQLEVEISGVSTEVEVDYKMQFAQPEIYCIMDLSSRELVELDEIDNQPLFKAELSEWAINAGQLSMEYLILNS